MAGILENARLQGPRFIDVEDENATGSVVAVSRFGVKAELKSGGSLFETVKIGKDQLIGEIIRVEGDIVTLQVFENTSGLQVGDTVVRTHSPLSVELGPGLLGTAFDGLQRPLEAMGKGDNIYVPRSTDISALDKKKLWEFKPSQLKVGDLITGGDIFGTVHENSLVPRHGIMLHPNESGRITYIAPEGEYTIQDEVLKIEGIGYAEKSFTMMHKWPVRTPRPVVEKLSCDYPFTTGLRTFDALFPVARGGTCAIHDVYGAGKSGTIYNIQKNHNADILVHVAVAEQGNDIAELLMELPEIGYLVNGVVEPTMQRTCVYGNTANMPLGYREAAVYSGVTTAEYFRDQGLNVCYIADSTSRWAEAMKEISNFADMPSSHGYPPWIGSRLATFYDRAGKCSCLGSPDRTGSLTVLATVSPVGDGYSDDFVSTTINTCQAFWALDRKLAKADNRFFPVVNCLKSSSQLFKPLTPYFESVDADYIDLRNKIVGILEKEAAILETVQIIGRDNLSDYDKFILELARVVKEEFLHQNFFAPYDKFCPHYKSAWMMRNIIAYYTLALKAIARGVPWDNFTDSHKWVRYLLTTMKWQDPFDGEDAIVDTFRKINKSLCDGLGEW